MALPKLPQLFRTSIASTLVLSVALTQSASAQAHVVSPQDLKAAIASAAQTREMNRERINSFLSTPMAEKALRTAQVDVKGVKTAMASLSDEELSNLAIRAEKAQADFAAGRMSDRDLLWIVVAIAVLILVIIAVR